MERRKFSALIGPLSSPGPSHVPESDERQIRHLLQAGWAVVGVNANAGDRHGDSSFFARMSGLHPWLNSRVHGLPFGG